MSNFTKTVDIDLNYLIRECSKLPLLQEDIYYHFRLSNRENIHDIFKYKKFNEDFTSTISCYNDEYHLIGFIRPNYQEFVEKIGKYLNVPNNSNHDTSLLMERIHLLGTIQTEQELKQEFPYLFQDLIDGRKYLKNLEKLERTNEITKEHLETERHYYYACGLRKSLEGFLKTQQEVYRRFVIKKEEYKQLIENRNYNGFFKEYFDMDKVALVVMNKYVTICNTSNDKKEIKRYLGYLKQYQLSKYKKDITIVLENNKEWNNDILLEEIKEIEERLKESSKIVGWEIVPEIKDYKEVTETPKYSRRLFLSEEEIYHLRGKGVAKQKYYRDTNYLVKVLGQLKNKGYVAYIYPNGEVLLEREYNENTPSSALGNAIYIIKARDFERFSKLEKKELRKKQEVERMIHSKNWMDKLDKIITREGSEEEKQDAITLVKRFQK